MNTFRITFASFLLAFCMLIVAAPVLIHAQAQMEPCVGDCGSGTSQIPVDQESQSFYTDDALNGGSDGGAAGGGLATTDFTSLIRNLLPLVNKLIYALFGLVLITFMWSMVKYLYKSDSAEEREHWRHYMIYSVIAITVMVGIWGIVNGLLDLIGVGFVGPQFPAL